LKKTNIKVSLRTVYRKCKELQEQGFLHQTNHSKKGRKSILTEEEKMDIEDALEEDPTLDAPEIIEKINLSCSTRTMQRYLSSKGYKWKPIYDVFLLTPEQKKKERTTFVAPKHIRDLWRNTIFIDECSVSFI